MNLAFVSYGSISTRYHCNYDGLYFNGKGATLFTENTVLVLNKVEWAQSVKENFSPK